MAQREVVYRARYDAGGVSRGVRSTRAELSGLHTALNRVGQAGSGFTALGRAAQMAGLNMGPLGGALSTVGAGVQHVTDRFDELERRGSRLGRLAAATTGVGVAAAGIGAAATMMADGWETAQARLGNAVGNTGQSVAAFRRQINAAANSATYLNVGWNTSYTQLARLVTATHDTRSALTLFGAAENIAAQTGMGLEQAVTGLAQTMGGRAPRAFAQLGISTDQINAALGKATVGSKAHAAATRDLARAEERLAVVEARAGIAAQTAGGRDAAAQRRRSEEIQRAIAAEMAAETRLDDLRHRTGVVVSDAASHARQLARAEDAVTAAQNRLALAQLKLSQGGRGAAEAQLRLQEAQDRLAAAQRRLVTVEEQGVSTHVRGAASATALAVAQAKVSAAAMRVQQAETAGLPISKLSLSARLQLQLAEAKVAAAQQRSAETAGAAGGATRTLTKDQQASNIAALALSRTHGALARVSDTLGARIHHVEQAFLHEAQVLGQKYGPAVTAVGVGLTALGSITEMVTSWTGRRRAAALAASTAVAEQTAVDRAAAASETELAAATAAAAAAEDLQAGSARAAAVATGEAAAGAKAGGVAAGGMLGPIGLAVGAVAVLGLAVKGMFTQSHQWSIEATQLHDALLTQAGGAARAATTVAALSRSYSDVAHAAAQMAQQEANAGAWGKSIGAMRAAVDAAAAAGRLTGNLAALSGGMRESEQQVLRLAHAAGVDLSGSLVDVTRKLDAYLGRVADAAPVDQAATEAAAGFGAALTDVRNRLIDGMGALDAHSAAGRADRQAMQQAAVAALAQATAVYDATGSARQADAVLAAHQAQLEALGHAYGLTRGQIDALTGDMSTLAGQAGSWGEEIGRGLNSGLLQGLGATAQQAMAAAEKIGEGAAVALRHGAQISSPSALTVDAGRMLARGLLVGFADEAPDVFAALQRAGKLMATAPFTAAPGAAAAAQGGAVGAVGAVGVAGRGGGGSGGGDVIIHGGINVTVDGKVAGNTAQVARELAQAVVAEIRRRYRATGDLGIAYFPVHTYT